MDVKCDNKIQLMHGDCLELLKTVPDDSVDMVLTDLPYGTTRNKWDAVIPMEPLWNEWRRVCTENAAIVLFSQLPFAADLVNSNRPWFRYEWVWQKNMPVGFLNAHKMPLRAHENILVFYKKLPVYNPQKRYGYCAYRTQRGANTTTNYGKYRGCATESRDGSRFPIDVLKYNNSGQNVGHPTAKPVPLLEYLILTYTNENAVVLDCCMGSGSTGVACVHTGRRFIGMELNDNYFNIAEKRVYGAEIGLFAG